jgi:hypothetical protein
VACAHRRGRCGEQLYRSSINAGAWPCPSRDSNCGVLIRPASANPDRLAARFPGLEDLIEKARFYIHAAKSPATLRAWLSHL